MYDTVAKLAAVEDLSGVREQNTTLSDGAAAKMVKHLPAAFKDVARRGQEYARANPGEMAQLEELAVTDLPSQLRYVDPIIKALLLAPASVQEKLEGKLGTVVQHLFRLSVDATEAEAFPCSVRGFSSSSTASDPFRAAAEDLVRRNLKLNNWKRAFVAMAGTDQRIARLVQDVSPQEISSPRFPIVSTWWADLGTYLNTLGPGLPGGEWGNIVSIANKLVQDGVPPGAAATFVDRIIFEQQYTVDGVRTGRVFSTALLPVKPTFHGQQFTDKLTPFYDDLLRQGAIARAVGPEMAVQVRDAVQLALRLSAQSTGKRKTGDADGIDKSDGTVQSKQIRKIEISPGHICYNWNGQSCPMGDDCIFQHIPGVDTTTCKRPVPCYNWDGQSCSFGSGCNFEHLPGIDTRQKAVCRDFVKGSCARGAECRFKHE